MLGIKIHLWIALPLFSILTALPACTSLCLFGFLHANYQGRDWALGMFLTA